MIVLLKEFIGDRLVKDGFTKKLSSPGVPAITFTKGSLSISFACGRWHIADNTVDYFKSLGVEYKEIVIPSYKERL